MGTTRVLLLAGTSEAVEAASLLAADAHVDVEVSLAGRTRDPARFPCPVRVGGFGGPAGLADWLRSNRTEVLVDATHPFAAVMPHNAAAAAATAGTARVRLIRPPWQSIDGDRWYEVASLPDAAEALAALGARRVLLTTGRVDLMPFAAVADTSFVVRSIEPPDPQPLDGAVVVRDRGPYTVDGEIELLREHRIDVLVSRNSGGSATASKLAAARMLGLPVVMVRRPPPPPGPQVATPGEAVSWVRAHRRALDPSG